MLPHSSTFLEILWNPSATTNEHAHLNGARPHAGGSGAAGNPGHTRYYTSSSDLTIIAEAVTLNMKPV